MRAQRKNKLIFGLIVLNLAMVIIMVSHRHKPVRLSNDKEIKAIRRERDSLMNVNRLKDDTLRATLVLLEQAHNQTRAAHQETQKAKKEYEKIKFVPFKSDYQRDSVLFTELYPAYRPIR